MSAKPLFIPGQRLVSDSEPELGLGIVLKAEFGRVEVFFPASSEHRQYALASAPLRRVIFKEGDQIKSHSGESLLVESVEERGGLLVYHTDKRELAEAELSDSISFSKPEDRLLGGQIDDLHTFGLRVDTLRCRHNIRRSPVRGFVGGRMDLIEHQMYIAGEVASRLVPRVLLADEVGLGKTIEAGLILHRLHITGRAGRILILVPEPLVHQWFIELYRRFNLSFSIFDEARCEALEANNPETNPFLDSQLVLCSVDLLTERPERAGQVLESGWDLLVVDEAHHLQWSPEQPSVQYLLVQALAQKTQGLLLLTATPQQLGPESHFARLRLLDPDRYSDLARFTEEATHYEHVAKAVDRVLDGKSLSAKDLDLFGKHSPRIRRHCEELMAGDADARPRLVSDLLDSFGTGRVMFRNTRAALSGFPERTALLAPLDAGKDPEAVQIKWLAAKLKELGQAKVLLICKTRELVEATSERLQREMAVNCALFHEGLTLMQRDRNAAYFAEEDGARILICSEIGSEGRNFQFAHHLVLWDLPENPELLEQRIGRLDRIGQTATIQIHVPYFKGSASEVLARWYQEGLNAFEKNLHGAAQIADLLGKDLESLLAKFSAPKLEKFLERSRQQHGSVAKKLERGHDRLLELNSCRPERAQAMVEQIRGIDSGAEFETFFVRLLDHFGVQVEELSARSYLLQPGTLLTDAFPSLPAEGVSVTFERSRALSREDLGFMSVDHPMVTGAIDLLLGSEAGNTAFGVWKSSEPESVMLEIYSVIECVSPAALHADRFLPATPLRIVVDHAMKEVTDDPGLANAVLEKGDVYKLLARGVVRKKMIPGMLEKAKLLTSERMELIVMHATAAAEVRLQEEIDRLEELKELNDHIRPEELATARQQKGDLLAALGSARFRVDAIRLILRMPA